MPKTTLIAYDVAEALEDNRHHQFGVVPSFRKPD